MITRRVLVGMLFLASLTVSPAAAAKAFRPGEVSLCTRQGCVSIRSQPVLNALGKFYYDSSQRPVRIGAPPAGARSFKLEFSNDYVSGIAAGPNLDRFRSGGVNLEQFSNGGWYRLPALVSSGLRRLADAGPPGGQRGGLRWVGGLAAALATITVGMVVLARRRSLRLPSTSAP